MEATHRKDSGGVSTFAVDVKEEPQDESAYEKRPVEVVNVTVSKSANAAGGHFVDDIEIGETRISFHNGDSDEFGASIKTETVTTEESDIDRDCVRTTSTGAKKRKGTIHAQQYQGESSTSKRQDSERRKTTNKAQFVRLVAEIEANPNVVMDKKTGSRKFWAKVAKELNMLGPPRKDGSGWKKVWSDYKSSLKKKMSQNITEYCTARWSMHPCFSNFEIRVIELLGLHNGLPGMTNVNITGIPNVAESTGVPTTLNSVSSVVTPSVPSLQLVKSATTPFLLPQQKPVPSELASTSEPRPLSQEHKEQDKNQTDANSETVPIPPTSGLRRRIKSFPALALTEQRRLNRLQEKANKMRQQELEIKRQKLDLMKQRFDLEKEVAARTFEFQQECLQLKRETYKRKLELQLELANKELELKRLMLQADKNNKK